MSLMLRLLIVTVLLGSGLFASEGVSIEKFLKKSFSKNRGIVSLDVKVVDKVKLKKMKGWSAYIVDIDALVRSKPKNRHVKQKMIWFSNGSLITQDLVDMKSGKSLQDSVKPKFKETQYKKENLLYGNADAKHKVAIFSDPLCPFCKRYVPKAIKYMKKYPKKFAIYYYHFPLPSLHPAAVELTKAATALELRGTHKDIVLKLYSVKIDPKERNVKKILKAFNKTMNSNIKASDLNSKAVVKYIKDDILMADTVMVQGTPTIFFDGKIDREKNKYKTAK